MSMLPGTLPVTSFRWLDGHRVPFCIGDRCLQFQETEMFTAGHAVTYLAGGEVHGDLEQAWLFTPAGGKIQVHCLLEHGQVVATRHQVIAVRHMAVLALQVETRVLAKLQEFLHAGLLQGPKEAIGKLK